MAGYLITMKTKHIPSKPRTGSPNQSHRQGRVPCADPKPRRIRHAEQPEGIHWPTARELQRISSSLAKVSRSGRRQESAGDYFTSGDLAFQLQEIIRATAALLKKIHRNKVEPTPGHP